MDNFRRGSVDVFSNVELFKETLLLISLIKKNKEAEILRYYKEKGINRNNIEVTEQEVKNILKDYSPKKFEILKKFKIKISSLGKKEKKLIKRRLVLKSDLNFISTIYNEPLETVGIYIPQNLPSSLIFYCQLAKNAGVKNIVLALPPSLDGSVNPDLLAAASLFKTYKILAIGGKRAFPSLAFGLGGIIPDKLFGPCSLYVDYVKQILNCFYKIPVDLSSGPSELLVFIDNAKDIKQSEYDIRAQMEHGSDSKCFVLSTNPKVLTKLKKITLDIKSQMYFSQISDIKAAGQIINQISPEILEIFSTNWKILVKDLKNVANVYVNMCSPIGDYCVVGKGCADPTYGMARGVSGITLGSFYKTSCVNLSLRKPQIMNTWFTELPKLEKFKYHKLAIDIFLNGN